MTMLVAFLCHPCASLSARRLHIELAAIVAIPLCAAIKARGGRVS